MILEILFTSVCVKTAELMSLYFTNLCQERSYYYDEVEACGGGERSRSRAEARGGTGEIVYAEMRPGAYKRPKAKQGRLSCVANTIRKSLLFLIQTLQNVTTIMSTVLGTCELLKPTGTVLS